MHNIIIIGAGPAGLAVAGRLRKLGRDFVILEQSDKVASSWHGHYDRLHLHTVKELSHLPHQPFPEDYPTYVSRLDLIKYYDSYAQSFEIEPHFGHSVDSVERMTDHWKVSCSNGAKFEAQHIVITTGVNHIPKQPHWEGEDDFQGEIIHSRLYKNPQPFIGKKTLVIGMGNTGAEIALDLAEQGIKPWISVRSPINIVPRDLFGKPVQTSGKLLEKLPFGWGDWLGSKVRRLVFGDLRKYGIPLSDVPPAVQVRETGKTPVIDLGTVDQIKTGNIQVVGDIKSFVSDGVQLSSGEKLEIDAVILATGYRPGLTDFIKNIASELDRNMLPKQPVSSLPGLYFIGYDDYSLGGLLGVIYRDSETVVNTILNGNI